MLRRASRKLAVAAAASLFASACRSTIGAFGESPEAARRNADQLFAAFEYRFDHVAREPRFEAARLKMGRNALTPSRIYSDATVWTIISDADSSRATFVRAGREDGRFVFISTTAAVPPTQLGDESHYLRLASIGRNEYEWFTTVDQAVGSVKPTEVAQAIVAALTAAEGRTGQAALTDAAASFPRSATQLALLLSLDSLRTTLLSDGSTAVALGLTIHSERLRPAYAAFAAYLDKYVVPSVYRLQLDDARGATYVALTGRDGRVVVRLRAHDGRLVTLDGPPRPLPDSLVVRSDFSARYGVFRVGFANLVGDFIIQRDEHVRAWMMRFRREPEWHFPLAFDKLIRTPLRRPFQGKGAELRIGMRDDQGAQTYSFRQMRVVVSESAVMRWLGRIGATAFGEFSGETEAQENRFLAGLFAALRGDVEAMK